MRAHMITLSILLILKLVIVYLSVEYVLKELLKLEDSKAVGLDGLPPKLLRIAAPAIAAPLTRIFNM